MRILWSIILYISVAAYAQNISTTEPDLNAPASTTENNFPSSTIGNSPSSSVPTVQPLNRNPNDGVQETVQLQSCPEGYECYAEVFCENILTEDSKKTSNVVHKCPLDTDICCRRNQIETKVQKKCGIRNPNGVGFRITGDDGTESKFGEFPWMAIILLKNYTENKTEVLMYQSGGSLIHPSVVLTAAHRVSRFQTNILRVRLGEWDASSNAEFVGHQDRDVAQVLINNDFEAANLRNDIALVFLTSPVDLNDIVQPICLPPPNSNFDHRRCFATGWGKDVYGIKGMHNNILKKVDLPIVPLENCQSLLRETRLGKFFELHDSFVCAGGEAGMDTCNGDGGSPLVCPIEASSEQYYQVGVVAWGIGCGDSKTPAVYTNVAKFRNWIDKVFLDKGLTIDSYTA